MLQTFIQTYGDSLSPYTVESFKTEIKAICPHGARNDLPGLYNFSERFRKVQDEDVVICDKGEIPKDMIFEYYVPCGVAHPGLCAHHHEQCLPNICAVVLAVWRFLNREKRKDMGAMNGLFWFLRLEGEHGFMDTFFALGYLRGANPRMWTVTPAKLNIDDGLVEFDCHSAPGHVCEHLLDKTFIGRFVTQGNVGLIQKAFMCKAPVDLGRLHLSAACAYLVPTWDDEINQNASLIYPVSNQRSKVVHTGGHARMLAGMKKVIGVREKTKNRSGIKLVMPKKASKKADDDESEWDGSESDSPMSSVASSEILEDEADHAPAPVHSLPSSSYQWGRPQWRISQLRGGGWGAICQCHTVAGSPSLKCQKSISHHDFTSDEQRCIMKQWLLLGLTIDDADPTGQRQHVHACSVWDIYHAGLPSEADLDAQAREFS